MRQMAIEQAWIDGYRFEKFKGFDGLGGKLWKYGSGLLFVILMTLLSVFGPRIAYSKQPPAQPVASQPAVYSIK
jgi:hypothetical protein